LFIAHGTEIDPEQILLQLGHIKISTFFDLPTTYLIISLPVVNKDTFLEKLTQKMQEKVEYYARSTY
jgi:hypothetical protein